MSKQEYLAQLQELLKGYDEEEVNSVLAYCEEYFEEASDEQQAMLELGTPSKFVAQLKAESIISKKEKQGSFHSIWILILGICSLPITLPLAFVIIVFIFCICIVLGCIVLSLVLCFFSAAIVGGVMLGTAVYHSSFDGNMLVLIGGGIISVGLTLLLVCVIYETIQKLSIWGTKIASFLYQKVKERKSV